MTGGRWPKSTNDWLNPDAPPDPELLARSPDRGDIARAASTLVNTAQITGA